MTYEEFQEDVNKLLASIREELGDPPKLMSYPVICYKSNGNWIMGHVVTHLSLEDWAFMHNCKAELHGSPRLASVTEKTDLV